MLTLALAGVVRAAEDDWEPDVYPQGNLFPSLIIGTSCVDPSAELFAAWEGDHLGDLQGVIGATIPGLKKGDRVKLVVKANALMRESKFEGVVGKTPKGDVVIHPKISYDYDRLATVNQVAPLDVTMELLVNGESRGEKLITAKVRSINDCLFGVDEDEENNSDYSWLFAAYVNENHPRLDQILKEALQTGIVSSFDGYQADDNKDVLQQIFAIWNVMQRHGMKYSDITTTAAESDGVYSQHVRLLDQSMDATQANCVDGSVLLAALLRKIGLRASLVLVPGHMFLAVDLNEKTTIGIETTLMGEESLEKVDPKKFPSFDKLAPGLQKASLKSFEGAVAVGTERLEKEADKFDSDDLQYQLIDVAAARQKGIVPIWFVGAAGSGGKAPDLQAMAPPSPTATPAVKPAATPSPSPVATPTASPTASPTPAPPVTRPSPQARTPAPEKPALDVLAGVHPCQGKNPDGSEYEGTVEMRLKKDLVLMEWTIAGKKSHGTGLVVGNCLGVALDDGLALYQMVPEGKGLSLIGRWAGEGDTSANEEAILIGDTEVSTGKFQAEKINGTYRTSTDGEELTISGKGVSRIVASNKEGDGQGLLLGDGFAVITPTGLMVLQARRDADGNLTLEGKFVDKSGKPRSVSLTPVP